MTEVNGRLLYYLISTTLSHYSRIDFQPFNSRFKYEKRNNTKEKDFEGERKEALVSIELTEGFQHCSE